MHQYWSLVLLVLDFTGLLVIAQAPDWGLPSYEDVKEYYDQIGENDKDYDMSQVGEDTEEHHENQHRVHEKSQENYYDVKESDQESTEKDQETQERSLEEEHPTSSTRKSGVTNKGTTAVRFTLAVPCNILDWLKS